MSDVSARRIGRALLLALAWALLAAAAPAGDEDRARQTKAYDLFEKGQRQFEDEHFDAAARYFQDAWELYEDPAYLFNIGMAFEKAQRWSLTVEHYQRFLDRYPDSPNRSEVERRLEAARASLAATQARIRVMATPDGTVAKVVAGGTGTCASPCELTVEPGPVTIELTAGDARKVVSKSLGAAESWRIEEALPVDAAAVRPPGGGPDRTGSLIAWGVGGAGLVTGVVFGVLAQGDYDDGKALADRSPLDGADYDALAGHRSDLERDSLVADIGFGTAVVGAVVGLVLWFTADGDAAPAPAPAGSTGGGATWAF
ncbi:MAG: tetratricopeptide repeat protein [Deltaproteobacteria bacterium]|nr:tetratricopeptide repeat protein [Deltaproteobacteria bacterium]